MKLIKLLFLCSAFLLLVFGALYMVFIKNLSPTTLLGSVEVLIPRGATLDKTAEILKENNIIRSKAAFQTLMILEDNEVNIVAGLYVFEGHQEARDVMSRIVTGDFRSDSNMVTFPEGITVEDIATIVAGRLSEFDRDEFVRIATPHEGFLFPETYFFHNDATPAEVLEAMRALFEKKTEALFAGMDSEQVSFFVTLASILEAEAVDFESRQLVSGILKKRLEIDMPLQVDASFLYIKDLVGGRNTYELTVDDLRVDSPYNTYLYRGLPPTPINNPGLVSLEAAVNHVDSEYLYYLSDTKGGMYYATEFEEHIENRQYLNH